MRDRKRQQQLAFCGGGFLVLSPLLLPGWCGWPLFVLGCYVLFVPGRRAIPVLTYHSVHTDQQWMGAPDLVVSPHLFALQMQWLARRGYQTVWMEELFAVRQSGKPHKCVAVHFDDGYEDTMRFAEPVLRANGLRATVFIAPGLLREGPEHSVLPGRKDLDRERFLSPEDMVAISSGNILEVQAHGWTHREMTQLTPEALRMELCDTRSWLSEALHRDVRYLCFPRDARNATIMGQALAAGYAGYTGGKGRNVPADPALEISRIYITESGYPAVDMLLFMADILLFRGVFFLWPFRGICKRLFRFFWNRHPRERVTP